MYINIYKASTYSYIDKNVRTEKELIQYLNLRKHQVLKFLLDFRNNSQCQINGWKIEKRDGDMPDGGEGYVDMFEESGALDAMYDMY